MAPIAYLLAMLSNFWSSDWHKFVISQISLCRRLVIEKHTSAYMDDTEKICKKVIFYKSSGKYVLKFHS